MKLAWAVTADLLDTFSYILKMETPLSNWRAAFMIRYLGGFCVFILRRLFALCRWQLPHICLPGR